ncbi:thiopurine S-methyltransferase [Pseudoalteromonas denitrificans]|jgi:thiopurine S-methyltransferase|uniref:Thiopurine S-methyltransferase n=1 Tax=Pseudoalteromonas denitrificans DSM 6059 TaxID=1123010 RepID=A0A1I1MYG3_9GAMM|nr:thiopurine S-methyltransferase [Pseudoalteromonas denitrificans]SFC90409.1 thiopurine S-methyltransferase [Pseudoalteromonas denitrificans DSM 6059]
MKESFWHNKWDKNEIGFHESEVNSLLIKHFKKLNLEKGNRVFIPLCGKTLDIHWLLKSGYKVVGAELSKLAVNQLFKSLGVEPNISIKGKLEHYQAKNIDIFIGNIFNISKEIMGSVDAVYDRAALVALPQETRNEYANHLVDITGKAPQLLICYEYEQNMMQGPPFSICNVGVKQHYAELYNLKFIESKSIIEGFKGKAKVAETAWLLQNTSP